MALKTFNLDEETYKEFSKHCKSNGISMSKKVENFIKQELEKISNPIIKKESKDHPMDRYC
ncbi:MAG: hypothetical protein KKF39_05205 [Nanoarchaeota archaeon]|nr:hypothetical protein [Nanoarchaeota archaeon]